LADQLLSPTQQRVVICVLAGLLLAVSMLGLWLCHRLRRAHDRLDRWQVKETDTVLALPDHRQPVRLDRNAERIEGGR
jgi:hypothetical protein